MQLHNTKISVRGAWEQKRSKFQRSTSSTVELTGWGVAWVGLRREAQGIPTSVAGCWASVLPGGCPGGWEGPAPQETGCRTKMKSDVHVPGSASCNTKQESDLLEDVKARNPWRLDYLQLKFWNNDLKLVYKEIYIHDLQWHRVYQTISIKRSSFLIT